MNDRVVERTGEGMIRTLKKHGNSRALVIDKTTMELLGIEADTPLQLTISGNSLIVTPAAMGVGKEKIDAVLEQLRPEYGDMLRRLAE